MVADTVILTVKVMCKNQCNKCINQPFYSLLHIIHLDTAISFTLICTASFSWCLFIACHCQTSIWSRHLADVLRSLSLSSFLSFILRIFSFMHGFHSYIHSWFFILTWFLLVLLIYTFSRQSLCTSHSRQFLALVFR